MIYLQGCFDRYASMSCTVNVNVKLIEQKSMAFGIISHVSSCCGRNRQKFALGLKTISDVEREMNFSNQVWILLPLFELHHSESVAQGLSLCVRIEIHFYNNRVVGFNQNGGVFFFLWHNLFEIQFKILKTPRHWLLFFAFPKSPDVSKIRFGPWNTCIWKFSTTDYYKTEFHS